MRFNGISMLLVFFIIFFSGCSQHGITSGLPQLPACGNGTMEFGEQCETSTACPDSKICTSRCTCEQLIPPKLPE